MLTKTYYTHTGKQIFKNNIHYLDAISVDVAKEVVSDLNKFHSLLHVASTEGKYFR